MIVAKIKVDGVSAKTAYLSDIPAGIIGAQVEIEYTDAMWSGLSKTVVFRGCCTKDVTNAGTSVIIPADVVAKPGARIMVGVYGVDADNNLAIPTLWASLGVIQRAADPSGDAATDPALPVWAQLDGRVTDLEKNPVDKEQVEAIVQNYMAENPAAPGPAGPQGEPGEDGEDGITPHIGENGNWWIGETDTGKPSRGADGAPGEQGPQGEQGPVGPAGEQGPQGEAGPQGPQGIPGDDYVLTEADKQEIAEQAADMVEVPAGGGGIDLGVTGATVGQTVKITAVDDNGVPTAWEAVDFPSGGGELEFIGAFSVEAGVSLVSFYLGAEYRRILIADASWATAALSSGEFTVWLNFSNANSYKVGKSSGASSTWRYTVMDIETFIDASEVSFANFTINSGSANGTTTNCLAGTNMPNKGYVMYPIKTVYFAVNTSDATFNAKTYNIWGVKA